MDKKYKEKCTDDRLKSCDSIEKLFELWEENHMNETAESKKKTMPIDESYGCDRSEWLTVDGKINSNATKIKVLFICRESHIRTDESKKDEIDKPLEERKFWFRDVVVNEKKGKYYNCTVLCLKKMGFSEEEIKDCAYMNINKRGGGSRCNQNRLTEYAWYYQDFIKKEIELINPEKIVFLGKMSREIYKIVRSACEKRVELFEYPRHPSVYWKSSEIKEI